MAKIDTSVRPFSGKDEWGYIFGDMAGSFVNLYVDAYFLTFCTYCLGIDAKWMAGLFLFARLWDAINDPIIGSFPDRWHLGRGKDKFTPWIKLFMIPLALSGILCFWKVPLEGIALHAFVAFAYIFFGMSYTGTSMPFGAMANVVTVDPVQRSKLSRARSVGGGLVGYSYGVVDDPGLPLLEEVLKKYPNLIILGHSQTFWIEMSADAPTTKEERNQWGDGPVVPGGRVPELFEKYPSLYGDLSANSSSRAIMRDPEFGLAFLEKYADRLFFATDMVNKDMVFPLGAWLDEMAAAGKLREETYEKIVRKNAERIFGL